MSAKGKAVLIAALVVAVLIAMGIVNDHFYQSDQLPTTYITDEQARH